jgi:hypothetical protein
LIVVAGACLTVAVAFLAFTNPGRILYASIAAPYPEAWLRVKRGMTSEEARMVAGAPWADGRGLKVVDRWQLTRNGVELHLHVYFKGENDGTAVIDRVVRFKHLLLPGGANFDTHADPP